MRRSMFTCLLLLVGTLPITINVILAQEPSTAGSTVASGQDINSGRSWPFDSKVYVRKAIAEDYDVSKKPTLPAAIFVRDVVVSNTDPNLTNTDTFGDQETTIAINPANANEIVITSFSGGWGANAPIWHSIDGGNTWTKRLTVPVPPGAGGTAGCPCDQAVDYGRGNRLSGTFLSFTPTDVYSGTTANPTSSAAWNWFVTAGVTQRTNSVGVANVDQPWLLVARDTATASQDNVYVAYDNFSIFPIGMRIAVAAGSNPPNFTVDNTSGTSTNCNASICINPGHRLAFDPRNGFVYSLFQQLVSTDPSLNFSNINYTLNRSTDSGATWGLNASASGITVANADSTQPTPKFGTVNALLGGVHHAAVDPNNGDVYYVYGNRDSGTGNNRISIRRLTDNGSGGLNIGASHFVTGQVQAALPSVAVASNGIVGVLYTTSDGMSGGFPQFTAHFATSTDQGATFTDNTLLTFLSSATDNGNSGQRVLGDYNQVKSFGTVFYGVFTGNGAPLGRPFANHDPIFFKLDVGCTSITCPSNKIQSNDPGQCGSVVTYNSATPNGSGCGTITCSPGSGSFFPVGTTTVTCTSSAGPTCTFTITVQDTQPPSITCPPNKTQSTDPGLCSAVVTYNNATATDNCPGVGTPMCSPPSGSTFPKGTTTVTCTVKDASNNMASCSFTVTVNDTEKPVITCPGDINVAAAASCPIATSAPVTFTVTATDNCPGVTFICKDQNGSVATSGLPFPVGTTTVTCTATDTSGNMSTCSFTIKVFSACLVDESNAGNVVLFNAQTGEYRFCCRGMLQATRTGVLTIRGCIGTIDDQKGNRKVHIEFDTSANSGKGKGTAALFLDGSTNPKCKITDMSMAGNVCSCP